MRFEYGSTARIPQLRRLWKEAFGDTDVFLDGFFESGFSPDRCRCIVEKDEVVSALYWFEGICRNQRFAYLYAVATAQSHRGRGLFTALLGDVKQILAAQSFDGILLVPENEGLARMYEKLGFSCCTAVDRCTVAAAEVSAAVREIGAAEFAAIRRTLLPEGAVLQEGAVLPFLASQYRFFAGDDFLAIGQVYEGKLHCQEFLGEKSAMAGLVKATGAQAGAFRTVGTGTPFAWYLPLTARCVKPVYFALALD